MLTDKLTRKIGYIESSSGGRERMGSRARPLACYLIGSLFYYNWTSGGALQNFQKAVNSLRYVG